MENLIEELTKLQMQLMGQRRDHNGNILDHEDIDQIQETIGIIKNLIIDKTYIWKKPKS